MYSLRRTSDMLRRLATAAAAMPGSSHLGNSVWLGSWRSEAGDSATTDKRCKGRPCSGPCHAARLGSGYGEVQGQGRPGCSSHT